MESSPVSERSPPDHRKFNDCTVLESDAGALSPLIADPSQHEDVTKEGEEVTTTDLGEYSGGHETTNQGPLLPILQKIVSLSSKVQNLKMDHKFLSEEMTSIIASNSEFLDSFRLLSNENEVWKKKFSEEASEKKRLYNEVIELKGNIRVFCRCRPLSKAEISNGANSAVDFDPNHDTDLQINSDSSKKQFKFDKVFNPDADQETVFAETKPIITSVLDGYNVCIFAYGQTGSGKTFTMEGTPENRGVNYRALEELFNIYEQRSNFMRFATSVSMLEVYNEKIRDLLAENSDQTTRRLEIKQSADGSQEVPGLVEAVVNSTKEVWDLLKTGGKARSVGSTGGNEFSSRSHCLLRVTVKGDNLITGNKTKSHLWLVDLAGSERVGKIDVEGERMKESQFINKSLSALGDVIAALASKTGHIPYRNSKLTHILQSSLGGDCKTLMFVQISPNVNDVGETVCSLNFATRVRGVENGPARKHSDLSDVFKYKQMAEKLRQDEKEVRKLQENAQSLQLRLTAKESVCKNLQEKVRDLENQLAEERKTRLKQEQRASAAAADLESQLAEERKTRFKQQQEQRAPLKMLPIRVEAERQAAEKPPLAPKMRMPLRKITNLYPQTSQPQKSLTRNDPFPYPTKENTNIGSTRKLMQARRASVAVRPTQAGPKQVLLPRRRVSIATLRPEVGPSSSMATPLHRVGSALSRQSLIPRRGLRNSSLFTPMPEFAPLAAASSGSKFMRSPIHCDQLKARHPAVVSLQRKSLVWSPLKLRGFNAAKRCSMLPTRIV